MYITGEDRIQTVSLARFLPPINPDCYDNPKVCEAKRLDIAGGDDGQLSITLYADEQPVALLNLQSNQFSCGNHTLLVDTAGGLSVEVGPPMMPIVAVGWSDANSLFWKADDGGLRVRKLSKTSVALMLAIPISIDEESWARFRTTEQGCD